MQIVHNTAGLIFAFGALVETDDKGIISQRGIIPYNALAVDGLAPVQADFTIVTGLQDFSFQSFAPGRSHEYVGGAIQGVDGYEPPAPPARVGRSLTAREFRKVGLAYNAALLNIIIIKLPLAAAFIEDFKEVAGIEYADATKPATATTQLFALAKAMNLITDQEIAGFLAMWVVMFPA